MDDWGAKGYVAPPPSKIIGGPAPPPPPPSPLPPPSSYAYVTVKNARESDSHSGSMFAGLEKIL